MKESEVFRQEESATAEIPWCRVEYRLTEEEILQGWKEPKVRRNFWRNVIYTVLLTIIGGTYVLSWFENRGKVQMMDVFLPIVCGVVIFAMWGVPAIQLRKNARDAAGTYLQLSFFEDAIRVATEKDLWWIKRNEKMECTERAEVFVISLPAEQMLLIPKRCFEENELEAARKFFRLPEE